MPFIPDTFQPPLQWSSEHFQLQVLSPPFAQADFDAVTRSADAIRHVFGPHNDWPSERISYEENLADLSRHAQEFQDRQAFAYAMLDPTGQQYLGCVYLRPIKSKLAHELRKQRFQAQCFFWLTVGPHQPDALHVLAVLKDWLSRAWPWDTVAFPGRDMDWLAWSEERDRAPDGHL